MAKKVFAVYLAKEGNPNSDAYAKLDLPASPWELWDALDKVRLQTDDILYMEIEDYDAFAYLAPHLDGLEISLNELNDLAALLSALDEIQKTETAPTLLRRLRFLEKKNDYFDADASAPDHALLYLGARCGRGCGGSGGADVDGGGQTDQERGGEGGVPRIGYDPRHRILCETWRRVL